MAVFEINAGSPPPYQFNKNPQCAVLSSLLRQLPVGNSFDIPTSLRKHLSWYSWNHRRKNPRVQFITKTVTDENGQRVVRVWRMEDLVEVVQETYGFTDSIREQISRMQPGDELFIPCAYTEEIGDYIRSVAPIECWVSFSKRQQVRRRQIQGLMLHRKA